MNSNLIIAALNIRIRLVQLIFLLHPDFAKSLPFWLSQFNFSKLRQPTGQRESNVWTQQKHFLIGPILFLYYEESLVSSNLNSKLLRFRCAHPNLYSSHYRITGAPERLATWGPVPTKFWQKFSSSRNSNFAYCHFFTNLGLCPPKFSDLPVPLGLDPILWLEFSSSFLNEKTAPFWLLEFLWEADLHAWDDRGYANANNAYPKTSTSIFTSFDYWDFFYFSSYLCSLLAQLQSQSSFE